MVTCLIPLAGCSTYQHTATAEELDTDYQPEGVYVVQRDIYIKKRMGTPVWHSPTSDRSLPIFFLTETKPYGKHEWVRKRIPAGTRIKFEMIRFTWDWADDFVPRQRNFDPMGFILDGTHSGTPVYLTYISQGSEADPRLTYGKYVDSEYLKLINAADQDT